MESVRTEDFDYKKDKELEAELDDIHDKRTKRAQIRSKAKWIEDGEKNTLYFLRLEKQHQSSKKSSTSHQMKYQNLRHQTMRK